MPSQNSSSGGGGLISTQPPPYSDPDRVPAFGSRVKDARDLTGGDWASKPRVSNLAPMPGPDTGQNGLPINQNSGGALLAQYLAASDSGVGPALDTMLGAGGRLTDVGGQGSTDLGAPAAAGAGAGDFLPPLGAGPKPGSSSKPSSPPLVGAEPASTTSPALYAAGAALLAYLIFA